MSLKLAYVVILYITWTLFFVAWCLLGIQLGPGSASVAAAPVWVIAVESGIIRATSTTVVHEIPR